MSKDKKQKSLPICDDKFISIDYINKLKDKYLYPEKYRKKQKKKKNKEE